MNVKERIVAALDRGSAPAGKRARRRRGMAGSTDVLEPDSDRSRTRFIGADDVGQG
ncbi:MAG: hypothetical protein Q6373_017295 [Candidatus Sigynarchaeota archaeon]